MAQEIKPTYVTFEQAKWLKEKGFNLPTLNWYHRGNKKFNTNDLLFSMNKLTDNYSAPEQWQVVEWFEKNHRVIITVVPDNKQNFFETEEVIYIPLVYLAQKGLHNIYKCIVRDKDGNSITSFKTRKEAISAAFDYIKDNNLI